MKRCDWCGTDTLYQYYHDNVWGRPVADSRDLFAKLCLDGQQAGLSWITILKKQESYYEAYDQFDPEKIIHYDQAKIDELLQNPGIVRNKLKVHSVIKNAKGYLAIEEEFGSFARYIWSFVNHKPIINSWQEMKDIPVTTAESDAMSKDLKKRGFSFVGSTICYAFMQAVGMVQDHIVSCSSYEACTEEATKFCL
jgi:DNA-3-methyladenine glycosylase I